MKKILQLMFHRAVLIAFAIVIQILVFILMIIKFNEYFVYFYSICVFLSALVVLSILYDKSNPSYKLAWIIPIMLFPIFGGIFYIAFGGKHLSKRTKKKMRIMQESMQQALIDPEPILKEMSSISKVAESQSRYIANYAYCPPYKNTYTEYLPLGEVKFKRLKEELKKAEHYIFLEYFIIQEGIMWDAILDILVQKARQGVDVRVIFDDMGCIMLLPYKYDKKLESMGIKCCVFNPFIPVLSSRFNNRDHRKIVVIDGHTGFTGGINLADEYINAFEKHGHWKDTSILIKGEAVWSLTVMFLSMWGYLRGKNIDYEKYRPALHMKKASADDGYVQPFADSPMDDEAVGATVYYNLISKAKRYVYINTPYLIIDNIIVNALVSAAKSGIDIRIVTPHIGDKWFVHAVTRDYYEELIENGVKIYEYTPGFMHAKSFVVDDEYAVVGSINLDYRSLFLHFECGTWLYRTKSVLKIRDDYLRTLNECQEITLEECRKVAWYRKLGRGILRSFAPLM